MDIKPVPLPVSLMTDQVTRTVSGWGDKLCLTQTGIAKDGGITNLRLVTEDVSEAEETIYTKSGHKVQLKGDGTGASKKSLVLVDGDEIGQVPPWALERRERVPVTADDCLLAHDGSVLALTIRDSVIKVSQYNADTMGLDDVAVGACSADYLRGWFVRYENHTLETGLSFIALTSAAIVLIEVTITEGVIAVTSAKTIFSFPTTNMAPRGQVYAWYANGWAIIRQGQDGTATQYCYLLKSDKTSGGTIIGTHACVRYVDGRLTLFTVPDKVDSAVTAPMYSAAAPTGPGGSWAQASYPLAENPTSFRSAITLPGGFFGEYQDAISKKFCHALPGESIVQGTKAPDGLPQTFGIVHIEGSTADGPGIHIKGHTIGGQLAYYSACAPDPDYQAVPLTEIGDAAPNFCPYFAYDSTTKTLGFVYQRGDLSFGYVRLSVDPTFPRLQEIAPDVVAINCITPLSIVNAANRSMEIGPAAYNGAVYPTTSTATGSVTTLAASRISGQRCLSVDTGATTYANGSSAAALYLSLAEPLMFGGWAAGVDFYQDGEYLESVRGRGKYIDPRLVDTLYVEEDRIPPPIGAPVSDLSLGLINSTAIRDQAQYAYQLGNEIPGRFESFMLHGRLYLFDGSQIQYATIASGIIQRVDYNSNALGLQLLASAPTVSFFYSPFDHSLWTFDGGETLAKIGRLAPNSDVFAAGYSVYDNALAIYDRADYLNASGSIWFLRDGVLSRTPFDLTGTESFNATGQGTWMVLQGDEANRISYYAETGDSILPLRYDSLYCGYSPRLRQVVDRYAIRLLSPETETITEGETTITQHVPADIDIAFRYFTEEKHGEETATVTVGDAGHPYDAEGYAYIEFAPAQKACVAASLSIACEEKIVIADVTALTDKAGSATIRNRG